jgi:hypothetical protein
VAAVARRWPAAVDGLVDGGVVAFAAWTLWYEIALAAQFDLRPSGWPFAVGAILVMAAFAARSVRASEGAGACPSDPSEPTASTRPVGRREALWVAGLACLVVAVLLRETIGVVPTAVLGILLVAVSVVTAQVGPTETPATDQPVGVGSVQHGIAAVLSVGAGVLTLFLVRYDADDVFYVNRAAWVADHGTAALNDTMFGPDTLTRASGNGLPTPSIEALQGVLAHLLGVEAASFAYLVYAPLLAAALVWVTWRLVRAWAPRRQVLVLSVALLFVVASGASIVGNYSIGRIWQGKVTAYAVLVPIAWWYLTSLASRSSRAVVVLLGAAGVAFVGLTTTSALMAPVLLGGALVAALLRRSWRLVWGGLAFATAPIVNGVVQLLAPAQVGDGVTHAAGADAVFGVAFGPGTAMATLAVAAMVLATVVVLPRALPVAAAAAIVSFVVYLPGVIGIADAVTGAGPVVWRLAIAAPVWVFVGLLVAVPHPSPRSVADSARVWPAGAVSAAVLALVVAVPLAAGHWLWSPYVGGRLAASPSWKVGAVALADVRAARALKVAPGLWLMPPAQMEVLAISTAGPYAVVPRRYYLPSLDVPGAEMADREALYTLVDTASRRRPSVVTVRAALHRLGVSLACVPARSSGARHVLTRAVGAALQKVGSMRCHVSDTHVAP